MGAFTKKNVEGPEPREQIGQAALAQPGLHHDACSSVQAEELCVFAGDEEYLGDENLHITKALSSKGAFDAYFALLCWWWRGGASGMLHPIRLKFTKCKPLA